MYMQMIKASQRNIQNRETLTLSVTEVLESLLVTESVLNNNIRMMSMCLGSFVRLREEPTFPLLTTSCNLELIDSEVLAALDFLTGAILVDELRFFS